MKAPAVRTLLFLLYSACWPALAARGQQFTAPPTQLHDSQHFGSEALACNGLSGLVIERDTFLFLPMGNVNSEKVVHRLSLNGTSDTKFDVQSIVRSFELADRIPYIWAFASGTNGDVFIMTRWIKPRVSEITNILHFNSRGEFEGIIPLEVEGIQVLRMAIFRDGKFIVIGGEPGGGGFRSVDIIIFAQDGKLLVRKPLRKLTDDENEEAAKERQQQYEAMKAQAGSLTKGDTGAGKKEQSAPIALPADSKRPGHEIDQLFFRARLTSSDDGMVYLIRPDKPGIVYRVESDGTTTEFPLKRKTSKSNTSIGYTQLDNLMVANGQLILFSSTLDLPPDAATPRHPVSVQIDTFNLFDGEPIRTYVGDAKTLGMIAVGWSEQGSSYVRYAKTAQPPGWEIIFATY